LDDNSLQKAVEKIPDILGIPSENLRNIAESYFSLEKGVDLYAEVYQKILPKL
jgi:hypothetical protein